MRLVFEEDDGSLVSVLADTTDLVDASRDADKFSQLIGLVANACSTAAFTSTSDPFSTRREDSDG